MSNQKFSQLNRDYAISISGENDTPLKRSSRIGLSGFLFGFLGVMALLVIFVSAKKLLSKQMEGKIHFMAVPLEKVKSSTKSVKAKKVPHSKQEYGFYTILPNTEIKSAAHEDEEVGTIE